MSLFSSLKPKAQLSRNVFDRSRTDTFSTKLGILTPCFVEHTVPDGKYKIDISDLVRLNSQVTANFVGFNQIVDFYFVPYSHIWRDFNKFYYGKGERTRMLTNNVNTTQPTYVPTFDLRDVVGYIWGACFDYVLYKRYTDITLSAGSIIPANFLSWAKLQGIVYGATSSNYYVDMHGRFCGFDQLRLLDMLGYGNFLPALKYALSDLYNATTIDIGNLAGPIASSSDTDAWDAYKAGLMSEIFDSLPESYPNVFAIMAYQKIFNDIYMNRIYPENSMEQWYNVDFYAGTAVPYIASSRIIGCLKPRFRQYKKDMFTGLFPNPQFGNVAVASYDGTIGVNDANVLYLQNISATGASQTVYTDLESYLTAGANGRIAWNLKEDAFSPLISGTNGGVSALSIRQSLAFQKYKESLLRAGNREEDLQRAMFGVGSKYIEEKYVDFLGSFQSAIQMNPVAATTEASNQNVGDLGAYAVGSIGMGSQKEISYDAKDFGMIIGICYIMPDTKYEAFGIDAHNIKLEREDYFNSKMQNLGLQPVYNYLANQLGFGNNNPVASVLGYLAENYEYKTAISKVHGEFFGSNPIIPIQYDTISGYDADIFTRVQENSFGAFAEYVAPRDVRDVSQGTKQMLYIAPWDADRIFNVSEGVEQSFDHFKFEMTFRCKAVLPMSVVGLPS